MGCCKIIKSMIDKQGGSIAAAPSALAGALGQPAFP
jgi:hypothetical protein